MLVLKKIITYIKNYWYVPLVVIAGVFVLLFLQKKDNTFLELYQKSIERNRQEIDDLEKVHQNQLAAKQKAYDKALREVERINQEYEKSKHELDDKKKKQVENLLKKAHKNPEKLVNKLAGLLDFKVIEVDE